VVCRYSGYCVGARDLTWSYVAFQTAADARQRLVTAVDASGLRLDGEEGWFEMQDGEQGVVKELLFQ
jgi:hypothetical protein